MCGIHGITDQVMVLSLFYHYFYQEYLATTPQDEYTLWDKVLTDSERRLIQSYRDDQEFPATVNDAINMLTERTKQNKPGTLTINILHLAASSLILRIKFTVCIIGEAIEDVQTLTSTCKCE